MAELKNTTFSDSGFLQLPTGTTAQRPSSPTSGMLRYNTTNNIMEVYDGSNWTTVDGSNLADSTGGVYTTRYYDNGESYEAHVFHSNGTFTPVYAGEVDYLIVAGGGAGGADDAGGGGGGGFIEGTTTVTPQSYTITVGAGGVQTIGNQGRGGSGGDSSAFSITATGGGGGGGGVTNQRDGLSGGSGGGGAGEAASSGGAGSTIVIDGATYTQGFSGGASEDSGGRGAGGGGAAGPGQSKNSGGQGGDGRISGLAGYHQYYAGGGGGSGGNNETTVFRDGGRGGSGQGAVDNVQNNSRWPWNGVAGTGGGGQGGAYPGSAPYYGGTGGSGVVVVRYKHNNDKIYRAPPFVCNLNEIDAIHDGLILHHDYGDPRCYDINKDPSVIYDLSSSQFTGSPVFGGADNNFFSMKNGGIWEHRNYGPTYLNTGLSGGTFGNLREFTLSIWVRKTSTQDAFNILGQRYGNNTYQALAVIGGNLNLHKYNFNNNGDINIASGSTNLNDSQWHYLAITYQDGETYTFVDGIQEGYQYHKNTGTGGSELKVNYDSSVNQSYRFFIGDTGPVLVYDRALSGAALRRNFEAYRARFGV